MVHFIPLYQPRGIQERIITMNNIFLTIKNTTTLLKYYLGIPDLFK